MHPTTIAMLLADARLPVGGNANSAGLEPALRGGLPPADVSAYMRARAATVSLVEAGTAVVARQVVLEDGDLRNVEAAWATRTPSRAIRESSRALGRGYLRLAGAVWPHPAFEQAHGMSRGVVLGVTAAASGLDAESLVRLAIYDDAQSVGSAMLKLEPLDPVVVSGWVAQTCAAVDHMVPLVAAISSTDAIPALGAPQIEQWAEAHARTSQRLFNA